MTELQFIVFPCDGRRFQWRLSTVKGNHSSVVVSGVAYMTKQAAKDGARRFRERYLRNDAPIRRELA